MQLLTSQVAQNLLCPKQEKGTGYFDEVQAEFDAVYSVFLRVCLATFN